VEEHRGEHITEIRDDLKADVLEMAILIRHHEKILASIRSELATMLRLAHGVDLDDPETIVDARNGVIVHPRTLTPVAAGEAVSAPSGDVSQSVTGP
jgi:hypothetical protein